MTVDRDQLTTDLTALAARHGVTVDPVTLTRLVQQVGDGLDGLSEPTPAEVIADIEAEVSAAVLDQVPDATAWTLRADEWDNGWFLTGTGVQVTSPTGPQTIDIDEVVDDGTLGDLSHHIGGVGRWTEHTCVITDTHRGHGQPATQH